MTFRSFLDFPPASPEAWARTASGRVPEEEREIEVNQRIPLSEDGEKDRRFVTALGRGLSILRAFDRKGTPMSNGDFVERTGLSKSTISRLTFTLCDLGYLTLEPRTAQYRLTPAVLALGFSALNGMGLRRLAQPYMQALADEVGFPVAMAAPDQLRMIYLEECNAREGSIRLQISIGAHIRLSTSALGRAFMAALDDARRAELMAEIARAEGPERWPEVQRGIEEATAFFAQTGFCLSVSDWKKDIAGVAVPFLRGDGSPPEVVFNCSGPVSLLSRDRLVGEIGPKLVAMVRRIEGNLG